MIMIAKLAVSVRWLKANHRGQPRVDGFWTTPATRPCVRAGREPHEQPPLWAQLCANSAQQGPTQRKRPERLIPATPNTARCYGTRSVPTEHRRTPPIMNGVQGVAGSNPAVPIDGTASASEPTAKPARPDRCALLTQRRDTMASRSRIRPSRLMERRASASRPRSQHGRIGARYLPNDATPWRRAAESGRPDCVTASVSEPTAKPARPDRCALLTQRRDTMASRSRIRPSRLCYGERQRADREASTAGSVRGYIPNDATPWRRAAESGRPDWQHGERQRADRETPHGRIGACYLLNDATPRTSHSDIRPPRSGRSLILRPVGHQRVRSRGLPFRLCA